MQCRPNEQALFDEEHLYRSMALGCTVSCGCNAAFRIVTATLSRAFRHTLPK